MTLQKVLNTLEARYRIHHSPKFASSVHWTPSEKLPVHRWFRYREGFSPFLLKFFPESRHRLDPFCGCGTTLLESAKEGYKSYGIDLNPLATFVARVKTRSYNEQDKKAFARLSLEAVQDLRHLRRADVPAYPLLSKLYLDESLDTLLRIRTFVDNVKETKLHDLLFLVWLSILEDSSNTFKEGNGLKYRNKLRKPGRYDTIPDRVWIPRFFGSSVRKHVIRLWKEKSETVIADMAATRFPRGFTPVIRTGSSLEAANLDFDAPIDLAIFSPPYANRFDYFEAFKIELWMGEFVKTRDDMMALRHKSVRNNLAASRYSSPKGWSPLAPFLAQMDEDASSVRMGIKNAMEGYFFDLRILLASLRPHLTRHGKVVAVIGNSAYAKSIIPSDLLFARLGEETGYAVRGVHVARPLHVSSQQRDSLKALQPFMRESVVILEKAA